MIEYAIKIKYAENKYCRDNGFYGGYIKSGFITADLAEANDELQKVLDRIELRKVRDGDHRIEDTAKLVMREVTDWRDVDPAKT